MKRPLTTVSVAVSLASVILNDKDKRLTCNGAFAETEIVTTTGMGPESPVQNRRAKIASWQAEKDAGAP